MAYKNVKYGKKAVRRNYSKIRTEVELPDLLEIQTSSFEKFVSEDLKEKTIWYKLPDGWIEESSIYICNNQFQAKTAAKKITGDQ